ncbi:hypothetical protein [Vibrio owensii]|uniref:hypothetical protein n=1 Tax=Vibrio harveyi group TaxID=717610 RepID=UPI003CC59D1A
MNIKLTQFTTLTQDVFAKINHERQQLSAAFSAQVLPFLQSIANENSCDLEISLSGIQTVGLPNVSDELENQLCDIHEAIFPYLESIKPSKTPDYQPLYSVSSALYRESNHLQVALIKECMEKAIASDKCYLEGGLVSINTKSNDSHSKVKVSYSNAACGYFMPDELEILVAVSSLATLSKNKTSVNQFFSRLETPKLDVSQYSSSSIEPDMIEGWILSKTKIENFLTVEELHDWHDCIIVNKKTGRIFYAKTNPEGITGEFGFDVYFGDNEFSKYAKHGEWKVIAELK